MDIDAALATALCGKEQARTTWKKSYGFHPESVFAYFGAEQSGEVTGLFAAAGQAGPTRCCWA